MVRWYDAARVERKSHWTLKVASQFFLFWLAERPGPAWARNWVLEIPETTTLLLTTAALAAPGGHPVPMTLAELLDRSMLSSLTLLRVHGGRGSQD